MTFCLQPGPGHMRLRKDCCAPLGKTFSEGGRACSKPPLGLGRQQSTSQSDCLCASVCPYWTRTAATIAIAHKGVPNQGGGCIDSWFGKGCANIEGNFQPVVETLSHHRNRENTSETGESFFPLSWGLGTITISAPAFISCVTSRKLLDPSVPHL